jgi:5'-nucleotidase
VLRELMKKRIIIDMDGVLTDVYARLFELHREKYGQTLNVRDVAGLLEEEAFPGQREWVSNPGFFRDLPLMPGSVEGMKKLSEKYDLIVVSLAIEFPNSLSDKYLWLQVHFPFISWKQIVFCGNKNIIRADIMIDDHPKNLDLFDGETIMFTQPHNMLIKTRHKRVESWKEIEKILLT